MGPRIAAQATGYNVAALMRQLDCGMEGGDCYAEAKHAGQCQQSTPPIFPGTGQPKNNATAGQGTQPLAMPGKRSQEGSPRNIGGR